MTIKCDMLPNKCLFHKIYNEYTTAKVPKINVVYCKLLLSNQLFQFPCNSTYVTLSLQINDRIICPII